MIVGALRPESEPPVRAATFAERASYFFLVPRLVTAFAVAVLIIGRRPQSFFNPQFWAEDGPVFYGPQLVHGAARTLFVPYAGYLQIVPRLTSVIAAHVPAQLAPVICSLVAYAIAIWACSIFVEDRFASVVRSRILRALVCCAFAAIPPAWELLGTITNVHWYLALAALLLLIGKPRTGRQAAGNTIWSASAIALCGLSAPETLIFAPFAIRQFFLTRDRFALAVPTAFLLALCVQALELVLDPLHQAPSVHLSIDTTIFATIVAFVHRVFITAVFGRPASMFIASHSLDGLALLSALIFAVVAALLVQARARTRWPVFVLLMLAIALIAVAVDGRGGVAPLFTTLAAVDSPNGERYFFLPVEAFILAAAILVDDWESPGTWAPTACFVALFLCGAIFNYRVDRLPDMHWSSYAPLVDKWKAAARHAQPSPAVSIPINPSWTFVLPEISATAPAPKDR